MGARFGINNSTTTLGVRGWKYTYFTKYRINVSIKAFLDNIETAAKGTGQDDKNAEISSSVNPH